MRLFDYQYKNTTIHPYLARRVLCQLADRLYLIKDVGFTFTFRLNCHP